MSAESKLTEQGNSIDSSEILRHQRQAFELLVMDKNLNSIYLVLYSWVTGQTCKVGSFGLVLKMAEQTRCCQASTVLMAHYTPQHSFWESLALGLHLPVEVLQLLLQSHSFNQGHWKLPNSKYKAIINYRLNLSTLSASFSQMETDMI